MSYYDDLGVTPDATPEQIRDSYRTLARLLHPDQQTDPVLRRAAETQMRRVNQLYKVLSEPERRRRYDTELNEANGRHAPILIQPPPPVTKPAVSLGALAWTAAALAGCAMIYWLSTQGQAPIAREAAESVERFAGSWVSKAFEATTIEATISEQDGAVSGEYRAEGVKFEFAGKAAGELARVEWKAPGTLASGTMRLKLLSRDRMEVNWTAAEQGRWDGPRNGAAVLTRRADRGPELR